MEVDTSNPIKRGDVIEYTITSILVAGTGSWSWHCRDHPVQIPHLGTYRYSGGAIARRPFSILSYDTAGCFSVLLGLLVYLQLAVVSVGAICNGGVRHRLVTSLATYGLFAFSCARLKYMTNAGFLDSPFRKQIEFQIPQMPAIEEATAAYTAYASAERNADIAKAVGKTAATAGGCYVVYRGIRMIPSLFPPLWWTIPIQIEIPNLFLV